MIIATREGAIIHADPITEEQREEAWKIVLSAYLKAHPEVFSMNGQDTEDNDICLT